MIRAYDALRAAGVESRILLQVHDELVLETVEAEIAQVTQILRAAMSGAAELAVPLAVDVDVGKRWMPLRTPSSAQRQRSVCV